MGIRAYPQRGSTYLDNIGRLYICKTEAGDDETSIWELIAKRKASTLVSSIFEYSLGSLAIDGHDDTEMELVEVRDEFSPCDTCLAKNTLMCLVSECNKHKRADGKDVKWVERVRHG